MKIIHMSDLHIGKRVNEVSMIEDQEYILNQIMEIIDIERPGAVLICGDIYDKSVPSAEAVTLFDDFLCSLAEKKQQVFIISLPSTMAISHLSPCQMIMEMSISGCCRS